MVDRESEFLTVGLVVSWSDHVWNKCRDGSHLVIKLVQDLLINLSTVGDSSVGKEALNLLFEPVIGVGNVTNYVTLVIRHSK
jgi:hypothetical protein